MKRLAAALLLAAAGTAHGDDAALAVDKAEAAMKECIAKRVAAFVVLNDQLEPPDVAQAAVAGCDEPRALYAVALVRRQPGPLTRATLQAMGEQIERGAQRFALTTAVEIKAALGASRRPR